MVTAREAREAAAAAMDASKYVRYTPEQVEALERLYYECPKPSSLRRQQLVRECAVLANVDPKQIKVWFQNRRARYKSKLIEEEFSKLRASHDAVVFHNCHLEAEVQCNSPAA